jgi:hypothetical protein
MGTYMEISIGIFIGAFIGALRLRPLLRMMGYSALLLNVTMHAAQAAEFDPVDLSATSVQSRLFEQVSRKDLVSACFSVIQDIGFHVVETESEPAVIVANSFGTRHYSLTINLQPTNDDPEDYKVRLMLDSALVHTSKPDLPGLSSTEINFYQDFFNHLNKTYFTERATQ